MALARRGSSFEEASSSAAAGFVDVGVPPHLPHKKYNRLDQTFSATVLHPFFCAQELQASLPPPKIRFCFVAILASPTTAL
jgi:hypothetical protein